jgi:hypothetical protein
LNVPLDAVFDNIYRNGKEYGGLATGWMTEAKGQEFSLLHVVQTGSEVHPTSYPVSTVGSFPGGK